MFSSECGINRRIAIFLFTLVLMACSKQPSTVLRVGTIAGPETELMKVAKAVALRQYHLKVELVPFTDYMMPNTALIDGSIDANMFQHNAYLNGYNLAHGSNLFAIGKGFIYPMGVYSKKHRDLNAVSIGAIIGIPNDPSNEARALLLLKKAHLIDFSSPRLKTVSLQDITRNPKHVVIKPMDAAMLARALEDLDYAVINTNYAIPAGLNPTKDALFYEGKDAPYANVLVVRESDKASKRLLGFLKALQNKAVVERAKVLFKGAAIPAW